VETDGDAADDPAIWVNPANPEQSLIVATQKQSGLTVYGLGGKLLQHRKDGLMNNVDLRDGFSFADRSGVGRSGVDKSGVIVAASKRDDNSIALYRLDTNKHELIPVNAGIQLANLAEIYGLCLGHDTEKNAHYVYLTSKTGELKQYRLRATGIDQVVAEAVRSVHFDSQIEGCVVDDETGTGALYVGEEDVGLWRTDARETGGERKTLIEPVGKRLTADVEGLAIWHGVNGKGYLVVSSQGDDRYVLFERAGNNAYVGDFRIVADTGSGIDGASETDGLEVTSMPLGAHYPQGLLIVQDGRNVSPQENQNFKLVSWQRVTEALMLP
jgi:3-phytase